MRAPEMRAWSFTGSSTQMNEASGEFSSAAILLCMGGGAATLVSAAVDQTDEAAAEAGWMRGATQAASMVVISARSDPDTRIPPPLHKRGSPCTNRSLTWSSFCMLPSSCL